MNLRKVFLTSAIAAVAVVGAGASLVFAAHENGEASNGGCDDFYWQSREPGENRAGESSVITASSPATAQVVISQQIDIPCDGTQQVTFNASASANAVTYLSTYSRLTCIAGNCLTPRTGFAMQQVCAPGDNDEPPANRRGMVILGNTTTFNDFRVGASTTTFCGAQPPGPGRIARGTYRVEVFAYQTNNTGAAAGNGARFDERALSIEMWGEADSGDRDGWGR